jgi:hypothetical protein
MGKPRCVLASMLSLHAKENIVRVAVIFARTALFHFITRNFPVA